MYCPVNHSDMRIDNSLDVYIGQPPTGYLRHYSLDFGEAFGGHGVEHNNLWDGFNKAFSLSQAGRNLVTLGTLVEPWENLEFSRWPSIGAFEADAFDPAKWTDVYPYEPMQRCQQADKYWAAKLVAAVTPAHLKTLIEAAEYNDPDAAQYLLDVLIERKRKVIDYSFGLVSPIEPVAVEGDKLFLRDLGLDIIGANLGNTKYEIHWFDSHKHEPHDFQLFRPGSEKLEILIPDRLPYRTDSYLRVDVWTWREDKRSPSAAQFHLRKGADTPLELVGVVH